MPRQTYFAKPGEIVPRWHSVDAEGQVLGRMASRVAEILMGKHRPEYTPHVDCGDYVVIVNCAKVVLTGRKREQKVKTSYTGYPGGLKVRSYGELLQTQPERIVTDAVRRMLPKSRLGTDMLKKLKTYAGADHPHGAQQPKRLGAQGSTALAN